MFLKGSGDGFVFSFASLDKLICHLSHISGGLVLEALEWTVHWLPLPGGPSRSCIAPIFSILVDQCHPSLLDSGLEYSSDPNVHGGVGSVS